MTDTPQQPNPQSTLVQRLTSLPGVFVSRNALFVVGFLLIAIGTAADVAQFLESRGSDDPAAAASQLRPGDSTAAPAPSDAEKTVRSIGSAQPQSALTPFEVFIDPFSNTYTVEPGDVLYEIALAHGTTTEALIELNAIEDPNRIEVGQVLTLPGIATGS